MLSVIPFIGAVFCIVVSATALDHNETIVTLFAKTYNDFLNFNTTDALNGNSDFGSILNELRRRVLPIGELVRIMPNISTSEENEENRTLCLQLVSVLNANQMIIVRHRSYNDVYMEYDTKILPILYEIFGALKNESVLVPEYAGNFTAICRRNGIIGILDKFDRIFRENCRIDCHPGPERNRSELWPSPPGATDCILKTLASERKFEKKRVTARVKEYVKDLGTLLITTILCDYSTAENLNSEVERSVFSHAVTIDKIVRHIVEYVNWKMDESWPNVTETAADITFGEYASSNSFWIGKGDYRTVAKMIQNRMNEIGDYRHAYQVLVSKMNTQTIVSIDLHDVIYRKARYGVDYSVVRHEAIPGWTDQAEKAHNILQGKYAEIVSQLKEPTERYRFRFSNISASLEELGTFVNLTIPSRRNYRTVVVEQNEGIPNCHLPYGFVFSSENSYWFISQNNYYAGCMDYRIFFLF